MGLMGCLAPQSRQSAAGRSTNVKCLAGSSSFLPSYDASELGDNRGHRCRKGGDERAMDWDTV